MEVDSKLREGGGRVKGSGGESAARLSKRDRNRENGGKSRLVVLLQAIGKRFSPWLAADFPHELFADA
jgi:hypothetical protein